MTAPAPAAAGHPCVVTCPRTDTRLYPEGYRCPEHTPAARAGAPEPDAARYCLDRCYCGQHPGYARPLDPITDTTTDFRAIASGKRRATPEAYRNAQAQVQQAQRNAWAS